MIDQNNLICCEEDPSIFKILEKHNITPHVIPFKHYHFWDNGIHCLTCDLDRDGVRQDYFPERQ
jgi:glycine amidinotransferase